MEIAVQPPGVRAAAAAAAATQTEGSTALPRRLGCVGAPSTGADRGQGRSRQPPGVRTAAAAAAAASTGADRGHGRGHQSPVVRRAGKRSTAQAPGGRRGTAVHATAAAAATTSTGADRGHGRGRQLSEVRRTGRRNTAQTPGGVGALPNMPQQRQRQPLPLERIAAMGAVVSLQCPGRMASSRWRRSPARSRERCCATASPGGPDFRFECHRVQDQARRRSSGGRTAGRSRSSLPECMPQQLRLQPHRQR